MSCQIFVDDVFLIGTEYAMWIFLETMSAHSYYAGLGLSPWLTEAFH